MLKIGWSRRDVSTDKPVMIPGQMYMRVSKGVKDPIMLNCLALENDGELVVFMSGDFVSAAGVISEIRDAVKAKRPDFPAEKILFNVTHTHCGPLITEHMHSRVPHPGLEVTSRDEYMEFFLEQASQAVLEAYDNLAEGAIAYGYGYAVVGHSRRVTYFDDVSLRPENQTSGPKNLFVHGHAMMYGNTNDTQFNGYEGGADHYVNLMYTFDQAGKLTGAIINVPCPSQNSEVESYLTSDYWADVRRILRAKYGDIGILSQCAAAGDSAPRTLHYLQAQDRRYRLKYEDHVQDPDLRKPYENLNRLEIAERICNAFDEVLSWAKKELIRDAKVVHSVRNVPLERRLFSRELYETCKEELAKLEDIPWVQSDDPAKDFFDNTWNMSGIGRYKGVISRYESQESAPETFVELHAIRVGDVAFASNPFELYTDYQHRIQARSPFVQTFIVQLCSTPKGEFRAGYLATERAVANVGYSAAIYDNQVSPAGGQTLVEETLADLNRIYGE